MTGGGSGVATVPRPMPDATGIRPEFFDKQL